MEAMAPWDSAQQHKGMSGDILAVASHCRPVFSVIGDVPKVSNSLDLK